MSFNIHNKVGEFLYLIFDPKRKGYLSWNGGQIGDSVCIMMWTTSNGAEAYNEAVLEDRAGEIRRVNNKHSKELVYELLAAGVDKMILDCPPESDYETLPLSDRPYYIINLKKVVKLWCS